MPPLPIGRHTQGLGSRTHPRFQPFRHLHDCSDCPGWSGCRVGLAPTAKRLLSTAHPAFVVRQRAIFDRIGAKLMQRQRVLWCKPDFRSFDVETIPSRGAMWGNRLVNDLTKGRALPALLRQNVVRLWWQSKFSPNSTKPLPRSWQLWQKCMEFTPGWNAQRR